MTSKTNNINKNIINHASNTANIHSISFFLKKNWWKKKNIFWGLSKKNIYDYVFNNKKIIIILKHDP